MIIVRSLGILSGSHNYNTEYVIALHYQELHFLEKRQQVELFSLQTASRMPTTCQHNYIRLQPGAKIIDLKALGE